MTMRTMTRALGLTAMAAAFVAIGTRQASAQPAPPVNQCATCHATQTDARLSTPAALFRGADVHRDRGFACAECHGGDQSASDKARAHDTARAFQGKPAGAAIVATCARCHGDAELM